MSDQWLKVGFDGSWDAKQAIVSLSDGGTERIGKDRFAEPLFREVAADKMVSAGQMLGAYFQRTGTTIQDYVREEALSEAAEKGACAGEVVLEIVIGNRAFEFLHGGDLTDFDKLTFNIEVTIRPKKSS